MSKEIVQSEWAQNEARKHVLYNYITLRFPVKTNSSQFSNHLLLVLTQPCSPSQLVRVKGRTLQLEPH